MYVTASIEPIELPAKLLILACDYFLWGNKSNINTDENKIEVWQHKTITIIFVMMY